MLSFIIMHQRRGEIEVAVERKAWRRKRTGKKHGEGGNMHIANYGALLSTLRLAPC